MRDLLGTSTAVISPDRITAYTILADNRRQFCWAHLDRKVQALADYQYPECAWAQPVLERIDALCTTWRQYRDGVTDRAVLWQALQPIQDSLHSR